MKRKLKSLRFRILLPAIVLMVLVITLLTTLFSRAFIRIIQQNERDVNAVSFSTVSSSVVPLINASVAEVRSIVTNERVASYARFRFDSAADMVHARIRCRDYLRAEVLSRDGIYGLLVMRKDGSLFGVLPVANVFLDSPEQNPLPKDITAKILGAPLGQTVWAGPVSGSLLSGFENSGMPERVMIAAWKSVHVSYGECFALMLMDESIFADLFAVLEDGKSAWHLFTEDQVEICHVGPDAHTDPETLIRESNSGNIFTDGNGHSAIAFSAKMEAPEWTTVREVSMEAYEQVVGGVIRSIAILGAALVLAAVFAYELWMRRFLRQFYSLQKGIVRMGQGDLESAAFEPTSIDEFQTMQREINRTRLALIDQMDTIRRMEREQMEMENRRKEQERIEQELQMAREIQASALPRTFPAFPDRTEFDLFASMTPAKEVGGDFYDFFMVDSDHLALVIADVSGKGIPAALFMMSSKSLIHTQLMNGCDPASAMERVNLQLYEHNTSSMFVTVWLAVLQVSTGEGLACNAGHENPVLCRAGEGFEILKYRHGMLAGISKKARYENRPFRLNPGDALLVYTDGVPEAQNEAKEMFGEERLAEALNRDPGAAPEQLIARVHAAVNGFILDAPQFDDITMLSLKYLGPGETGADARPEGSGE